MKISSLLSVSIAAAKLVSGHAYVWGIAVNGQDQGRGDSVPGYIRKIANNDPIKDVRSADMTCNRNKGPNSKIVNVKGGDKVCITKCCPMQCGGKILTFK
jgi:cellulase